MDKYEYKIREEEIKELISRREFEEAAEIADTIDWRRVKSVRMLCTVSDIYKKNRRYEDSRDMLLLAYERHPGGRTIVYSLCELAIKMGDFGQALEYCKEFVQIAPKDPGRYILQYKLYEAQDVGLEERIAVLEELKKKDYREKWAYELAYLYHLIGMETKCVEECDELIVWFGDGKYVTKAMELKMQHRPLTPQQQEKYDNRFGVKEDEPVVEEVVVEETIAPSQAVDVMSAETTRVPSEEIDIQVKTLGLDKCDTINLQAEVAAGLKELLANSEPEEVSAQAEITKVIMAPMMETDMIRPQEVQQAMEQVEELREPEAVVQEELSRVEETVQEEVRIEEIAPVEELPQPEEKTEVFFGETAELESLLLQPESLEWQAQERIQENVQESVQKTNAEPPKEMAKVLSMEGDGQLSFVMPESVALEKQITGQMNFSDILLEWERMKLELEEKRKENVRQMVLRNTGAMFTEFEASVRDGLLEQLENGKTMEEILPQAESLKVEEVEQLLEDEAVAEEVEEIAEVVEEIEEAAEVVEAVDEVEEIAEVVEEIAEIEETAEIVEAVDEVEEIAEVVEAGFEELEEAVEEAEAVDEVEEIAEVVEAGFEELEEAVEEAEAVDEVEEIAEAVEVGFEELEEAVEEAEAADEVEENAEVEASFEELEEAVEDEDMTESEAEESADSDEEGIEEEETQDTKEKTKSKVRSLTREEKELFAAYIQGRSSKEQLAVALDNISLAAYTGNVVITGREGLDTIGLAKNIIREIQLIDSNFSGKIAKISGASLNKRDVSEVLNGLTNGALIVQKAGDINEATAKSLYKALQQENRGIVVILEGTKKSINTFFKKNENLQSCFNARIDMEVLSDAALVAFGKKYAREHECSIDEFGVLALHRTITERQTSDHAVTIMEVKEIMDEAIESANRKTIGHFFAILTAKRYDEEDMIIIRENDFV